MQIKKSYLNINPEILYDEVRELVEKYGAAADQAKLQTYSLPSAVSYTRGTVTFKTGEKESLRAHIVGTAASQTKILLDIDDTLFPADKIKALEGDLDFVFGSYEES